MGVSPAMRMLDASKSLSFELIDLLAGRSGCNFRDAQHKGNGWSAVVWDLIRYSAVNTFNRIQRSGLRKQPRNVMTYITAGAGFVVSGSRTRTGVMATLFGEDFEKWLDGNDDVRFDMEESEEGDSPSVILLETSIGPQADESR